MSPAPVTPGTSQATSYPIRLRSRTAEVKAVCLAVVLGPFEITRLTKTITDKLNSGSLGCEQFRLTPVQQGSSSVPWTVITGSPVMESSEIGLRGSG